MIKTLKTTYNCMKCGEVIVLKRELVVDNHLKNIEVGYPLICLCSARKNKQFELVNLEIEDYKEE